MPRPVMLMTDPWADLRLEELAQKASEWGYQGLELGCAGDHLEVQRALAGPEYCQARLDLLARYDLSAPVLSSRHIGQAMGDAVDARHRAVLPDYVWGDGVPADVQQRAAQELAATVRAGQKLGVAVVSSFSGSPLRPLFAGELPPSSEVVASSLRAAAGLWAPVLDACRDCGVRLALEVRQGQMAFDLFSAEAVLDAFAGREEIGFTVNPGQLHWQGIDPAEFVRRFPNRIFHVHLADVALRLDGRAGILNGYLPPGDPRRGWEPRSPGRGGVDWEGFIRALNEARYGGALAVAWEDPGMDREYGAEDACRFVKRLDFEPARPAGGTVFRD